MYQRKRCQEYMDWKTAMAKIDKPFCRELAREAAEHNFEDRAGYTTLHLLLVLLEEDRYLKNKDKNVQIQNLLNKYCYKTTKLAWKVINKNGLQYIIVYGAYKVLLLQQIFAKYITRYMPEGYVGVSEEWDLKTNIAKYKKCVVLELVTEILNQEEVKAINKKAKKVLADYKIQYNAKQLQ
jgi:hypothetical protein